MSFTDDFLDLLTWSCQVSVPAPNDQYGNPQWATPVTVQAHVDQTSVAESTVGEHDTEGEERHTGTIYFGVDSGVVPVPLTKVTFPYGLEVSLTMVITHYDDDGAAHHYEASWTTL
jgi:hypothetical protein